MPAVHTQSIHACAAPWQVGGSWGRAFYLLRQAITNWDPRANPAYSQGHNRGLQVCVVNRPPAEQFGLLCAAQRHLTGSRELNSTLRRLSLSCPLSERHMLKLPWKHTPFFCRGRAYNTLRAISTQLVRSRSAIPASRFSAHAVARHGGNIEEAVKSALIGPYDGGAQNGVAGAQTAANQRGEACPLKVQRIYECGSQVVWSTARRPPTHESTI
ncbi:hypothetical protein BJV74DRAFT_109912 [Russula compacta]|nr:hypothetical protein BJV74DRAFT_109912 [Russula compacta]